MCFSTVMFCLIELCDVGLCHDFTKKSLPNLVTPSNCHFLLEFLKMESNGKVNIDLVYLITLNNS